MFRIQKDLRYINKLLHPEGFYITISNSEVEFQGFINKEMNILRLVLFHVCLKVSLNVAYSWRVFNVTQRLESKPNGDSASRPGLQFVSVDIMLMRL
jgi:hypothetical protein